jgi:predicted N-acetyltransferase YhbS
MQLPAIRPMTPADVEQVAAGFLLENWGDRRLNLEFVTGHVGGRPFVAEADGEIVGTSIANLHGAVAWIGTVWVRTDWRRQGLGRELTRATIDAAESAGARTLLLVATDEGRPLYEGLGFEVQTWYRILEAPGLDGEAADPSVRPYRASDLASMTFLDAGATGEDRARVLAAFATPGTARVLEHADGTLGAFVVRAPWGGAATIAPRIEDALAILDSRRVASGPRKHVRAGLIQENEVGLERLASTGWTESWRAPRLIRGEALHWDPGSIWGQFNFAMG